MPVHVDAIIVGAGLAGIHLALAMQRRGLDPLIIDQEKPSTSSTVAAGMINPITGRRFALTWMYDDLEKVFTKEYTYWQEKWEVLFFHKTRTFRSISQNDLINDLDARMQNPDFNRFCRKLNPEEREDLKKVLRLEEPTYVFKGFRLDTNTFLEQGISYFKNKSRYIAQTWDTSSEILNQKDFRCGNFISDKIIFCTGTQMMINPLFEWVPMSPNKGEVLLLKIQNWGFRDLIKHKLFFVPLTSGRTWVGTYNTRQFVDENPSSEGYQYIHSLIQKYLRVPYQIIDHIAALRPTMPDHKPVMGCHPLHQGISAFNGFGSKGSSLTPYFAQIMVDHLWDKKPLLNEVRLDRFLK